MEDKADNNAILLALGRIEGRIEGLDQLVKTTSDATNKRIDDLKHSVDKRIDDHIVSTDQRFDTLEKQISKKSVVSGAGAGAMMNGLIEVCKAIFPS